MSRPTWRTSRPTRTILAVSSRPRVSTLSSPSTQAYSGTGLPRPLPRRSASPACARTETRRSRSRGTRGVGVLGEGLLPSGPGVLVAVALEVDLHSWRSCFPRPTAPPGRTRCCGSDRPRCGTDTGSTACVRPSRRRSPGSRGWCDRARPGSWPSPTRRARGSPRSRASSRGSGRAAPPRPRAPPRIVERLLAGHRHDDVAGIDLARWPGRLDEDVGTDGRARPAVPEGHAPVDPDDHLPTSGSGRDARACRAGRGAGRSRSPPSAR